MNPFQFEPLDIPRSREGVARADLIFYGVDHSGPTYSGKVFLNNLEATAETPERPEFGFAGSFTVFGHGGCFGSAGHCAPKDRNVDEFDARPPHPLTPQTVSLKITEALSVIKGTKLQVVVVPEIRESVARYSVGEFAGFCESVRVVTYA